MIPPIDSIIPPIAAAIGMLKEIFIVLLSITFAKSSMLIVTLSAYYIFFMVHSLPDIKGM